MVVGNIELGQECSKALAHGNRKNKIRQRHSGRAAEGKKRRVNMESTAVGTKDEVSTA